MSKKDAQRLVEDLHQNQDLYDKVGKASQETLDLIRQHGYDVSADEIREAYSKQAGVDLPKTTDGDDGADPMTCFVMSEAPGQ